MASRQCRAQWHVHTLRNPDVFGEKPIYMRCQRRHGHNGTHRGDWAGMLRWLDSDPWNGPLAPKKTGHGVVRQTGAVLKPKARSAAAQKVFG